MQNSLIGESRTKMWKKILTMSLVLVMVLSFTTCAGLPSAQEIVDGVIEAQDDIRTYEYEMDMSLNEVSTVEGEAGEMTMASKSSGALDLDNRQMRWEMAANLEVSGEDEESMAVELYLVDNIGYVLYEGSDEEPVWQKQETLESDWEDIIEMLSVTEPQIDLLQAAQVEVTGSEKVKDQDCYLLQLTPDKEQLWEAISEQAEFGNLALSYSNVREELLSEMFIDFSVKQWVAKDTYFLVKAEIDIAMELTSETREVEEGEMDVDITISLLVYNHNQPVTIMLPPEAEEAESMESRGEGVQEAAETELANIQVAVQAMMVDNGLSTLPNPVTIATNDMSAFPDVTSVCSTDKIWEPTSTPGVETELKPYIRGGDMNGYVLYQHDLVADGKSTNLVNYIASQYTQGTYTIDAYSTVTQVTTGYE